MKKRKKKKEKKKKEKEEGCGKAISQWLMGLKARTISQTLSPTSHLPCKNQKLQNILQVCWHSY